MTNYVTTIKVAFITATLVLSASSPCSLRAQDESAPRLALEEVIVTAQKREQNIMDVPIAVQVLSGDYIAATGFVDFADYGRSLTNVSFSPSGDGSGREINIRGIAPSSGDFLGGPTVARYMDDTPFGGWDRGGDMDPRLFDIERIEVLKGPQGHLYGASAMGGVIKIITKQPVFNEFEALFDGTLSQTKYAGSPNTSGNVAVNVPLLDDVAAARIAVSFGQDSGFIDWVSRFPSGQATGAAVGAVPPVPQNDINHVDTVSLRAAIKFHLAEWLDVTPTYYYQSKKYGGLAGISDDVFGEQDPPRLAGYQRESTEHEYHLFSFKGDANTRFGNFISVTSYLQSDSGLREDVSNFIGALTRAAPKPADIAYFPPLQNAAEYEDFVQEIRFLSDWDFPIALTAGFFYQDRDRITQQYLIGPAGTGAYFKVPTDTLVYADIKDNEKETALFANLTYEFGRFEVQAGARVFELETQTYRVSAGIFTPPGPRPFQAGVDESDVSPSFSLAYHHNDQQMWYGRVAKGFRRGAVNPGPPALVCDQTTDVNTVESDSVWNYEFGAKTLWADGRLSVNTAVFQIDYEDVQQSYRLPCGFSLYANAGAATSRGVEVELSAQIVEGLLFNGGFGYVDSTLDTDSPVVGGDEGEVLLNVPDWTANASLFYSTSTPWKTLNSYFRLDWSYVDEKALNFGLIGTPPNLYVDANSSLSLRIGLQSNKNGWDVSLFGDNLLDDRTILGFDTFGVRNAFIKTPRTIGINFKFSHQ